MSQLQSFKLFIYTSKKSHRLNVNILCFEFFSAARLPQSLPTEPACLKFSLLVRVHIVPTLCASGGNCGNYIAYCFPRWSVRKLFHLPYYYVFESSDLRQCIRFGNVDVINVCLLKHNSVADCQSAVGTEVFIFLLR
jgi:hypothetical protein